VGRGHPLELLFPGGSFEFADYLYQQAPETRYFNNIARSVLEAVVKTQSQDKSLRILEVGGGTGGTTSSLLPILPNERTSYWFTDVSDLFLEKAKQKFKTYPFVRYGLLDIEQNPQNQGYQIHSFDVVVAVNVLHATRDIEETLENVRSLLAPGGLLVMVEVTNPQSWFDITVGLIEGWQRFDDNRRGDNPLLSQAQWESVLSDCGFERVLVLPSSGLPTEILGQNVLVAQSQLLAKDVREFSELSQTTSKRESAAREVEESVIGDRIVAAAPDNLQHGWESRLHEKVASILGISLSGVNLDTSLTNLGFDSLMAVELTNWIAKELGVNIPVVSFPGGASITQLTNQVREAMNHNATTDSKEGKPSPCLIALQPQGSKPPFFCVHPIAGVAFPYYELTYFLGNDQPFYGLQSFGLAGEGKPLTRIEDMAAHYIEAMQAVQPQGPYLLGGWSFGAHVAFEMAQQLQQKGQKVALLAILDTPPLSGNKIANFLLLSKILLTVSTRYIWPYVYDYFYLATATNQPKKAPEKGAWTFDKLSSLMRSSLGTKVMRQELKLMKLRQPILRHLLPVMWANNEALLNYVPKGYPGKITLFQTNQHLVVNQKDISWGWKDLSLKEVEICPIPGHHLNCLRVPHVKAVAEKLAHCIKRVESWDER
jgi:thioesterase domain-containing protein/ubiquinone/menaquinone biosynthesis C-methylase UbiE/acyl carrier protein